MGSGAGARRGEVADLDGRRDAASVERQWREGLLQERSARAGIGDCEDRAQVRRTIAGLVEFDFARSCCNPNHAHPDISSDNRRFVMTVRRGSDRLIMVDNVLGLLSRLGPGN